MALENFEQKTELIELSFQENYIATLHVIRGESHGEEGSRFHISGYIKECRAAIFQSYSWDEEKLKRKAKAIYDIFREVVQDEENGELILPEIKGFNIVYFDDRDEWLNK